MADAKGKEKVFYGCLVVQVSHLGDGHLHAARIIIRTPGNLGALVTMRKFRMSDQ